MSNIPVVRSSTQYIADRMIQPLEVIKDWNLDHHLAWVVKYIGRANRKQPIVNDLRNAVWHLERACPKKNHYHQIKITSQRVQLQNAMYPPQAVCDDWNLPNLLCSTLINIFLSQEYSYSPLQIKALNVALAYLREEIICLLSKND